MYIYFTGVCGPLTAIALKIWVDGYEKNCVATPYTLDLSDTKTNSYIYIQIYKYTLF